MERATHILITFVPSKNLVGPYDVTESSLVSVVLQLSGNAFHYHGELSISKKNTQILPYVILHYLKPT